MTGVQFFQAVTMVATGTALSWVAAIALNLLPAVRRRPAWTNSVAKVVTVVVVLGLFVAAVNLAVYFWVGWLPW